MCWRWGRMWVPDQFLFPRWRHPEKRNTGQKLGNQMALKSVLVFLEGAASGIKTHDTVINVSICYSCINKVPSIWSVIHKHHVVWSSEDWETPNESARRLTSQLRVYSLWWCSLGSLPWQKGFHKLPRASGFVYKNTVQGSSLSLW